MQQLDQFLEDQMGLISQLYPAELCNTNQVQPPHDTQKGKTSTSTSSTKPKRRRRRNKNGSGPAGKKRKLSMEQAHMLELSFRREHKLQTERKDRLAAELGLDPRQVAVWFQNRRARWKSKILEEEYSKLRLEHDSIVVEKCRLQAELLQLEQQLNEARAEVRKLSEPRPELITSSNSPISSLTTTMEEMNPCMLQLGDQFAFANYYDNMMFYGSSAGDQQNINNPYVSSGFEHWDDLYMIDLTRNIN